MASILSRPQCVNTLRPRQNGRHFADDTFKCTFLNENVWIPIKISLKIVPGGPINNIPALVQIMAWRRPGDKPLSETMMVSLPTHICVTRPQWVKTKTLELILTNMFSPTFVPNLIILTWKISPGMPKLFCSLLLNGPLCSYLLRQQNLPNQICLR